ncbi:MAG: 2-isopropylmalate synthase [Verrucomicrobiota bacterium]|nr:2-isopropylmalate synthase [Verrucomicrobiota bacterium]
MQKQPISKYRPFPQIQLSDRQWPGRSITQAPIWCSVDLRDGNQSLAIPMNVREKLEFFKLLVDIGFKEIEIGFPSASDTEFAFARELIEKKLIPQDVTIQVLVQCREHLIAKTFEAIAGSKQAIVHFYNSTNPLQRRVTFGLSKEEIKQIAVQGARWCKQYAEAVTDTDVRFEYSPESFSDTEPDYAVEICQAVVDVIQPTPEKKLILNLPGTVEYATPNVHADQIEYFCRHIRGRESLIISLHTHNDRGTGTAATELGLMAGADRVEGTLFGNGERTGNLDIMVAALNLYTQGIDPHLDFSAIDRIREVYERCTRMTIHERHPYAGELVFTAFSGSHQDAIKKGMDKMDCRSDALWQVPYLPIDPADIGRTYQAIIRINSQSGKGGVAYILEREFGFEMPKLMHPDFGTVVTHAADASGKELTPHEIKDLFVREYLERNSPLELLTYTTSTPPADHHHVTCTADVIYKGERRNIVGQGNGPIAALVNAIELQGWKQFRVMDFRQHALRSGSNAEAIAYIQIERSRDKGNFWGAAIDANIEQAGMRALISAFNRAKADSQGEK